MPKKPLLTSQKQIPVLYDGKPLYSWVSVWMKDGEIRTSYGCMQADSVEAAAAEALALGKKDSPGAQYISHEATQVTFTV